MAGKYGEENSQGRITRRRTHYLRYSEILVALHTARNKQSKGELLSPALLGSLEPQRATLSGVSSLAELER